MALQTSDNISGTFGEPSPVLSLVSDEGYRSGGYDSSSPESQVSDDQDVLDPIAVVGFSLKFPGDAVCSDSFWDMLMQRRCAMTEMPADRANIDAFYDENGARSSAINARGGHFLKEDLAAFDASFFSISPTEAASMDPQHRILLETTYRALENAGLSLEDVKGTNTGVYTGSFADDYRIITLRDSETIPKHAATGASMTMLAARLSWFFDLKGPAFNLDTACSSSMVALDVACQAIRAGDCDQALVGGANTIYGTDSWQTLSNMTFLSPDSRCFSFDSRGNGYARGEGFGVVVLKPLAAAIKNGDTIRGIIRSTGSNQDGHTPGITQPSGDSQEALIRSTYQKANLNPGQTRYFEAHGTGTALGDPTEAAAIASVFSKHRANEAPLIIGAVKSNIGHLEGASGIAGLIKALLVVEKGVIPPNANFEKLNPRINAKATHLSFPTQPIPWPETGLRRASVNSFGFGGTNSHVILDDVYHYLAARGLEANHCTAEVPQLDGDYTKSITKMIGWSQEITTHTPSPKVLIFSTPDEAGLQRQACNFASYFKSLNSQISISDRYMADLAYTLSHRRTQFSYRAFSVCSGSGSLEELDTNLSEPIQTLKNPGLCMVFTGQGSQYAAMGKELLGYPVFFEAIAKAEAVLKTLRCQWSLLEELSKPESESQINLPEFSQPLCTALQIAELELLRSFNVRPSAVVGHSSGEIAAAYATGALSLASAIKVAYFRGLAAKSLIASGRRDGSMLAVGLGAVDVSKYLAQYQDLTIACHNSPKSVTISGDATQIAALRAQLDKDDVFSRVLKTGLAYHSAHMRDIGAFYHYCLGSLEHGIVEKDAPKMVSSVHVRPVSISELANADYWVANLTQPVMFEQALSALLLGAKAPRRKLGSSNIRKATITNILEIGPHSTMQGPVRDCLERAQKTSDITYMSMLRRKSSAVATTLETVARLFCLGHPVDLDTVNISYQNTQPSRRVLADLPGFQFDHSKTYWAESRISKSYRQRKVPRSEFLGVPVADWNPHQPRWRHFIKLSDMPWAEDHKVNGQIVYPGTGMLAMAIEAAKQISSDVVEAFFIKEAILSKALLVPETADGIEVQIQLRCLRTDGNRKPSEFHFACYSYADDDWHENCQGTIALEFRPKDADSDVVREQLLWEDSQRSSIQDATARCTTAVDTASFYKFISSQVRMDYGPQFQRMHSIQCNDNLEATAEIDIYPGPAQHHVAHPITLDAMAQSIFIALTEGGKRRIPTTVPTRIENLWLRSRDMNSLDTSSSLSIHVKSKFQGLRSTNSRVVAINRETQEVVLCMESLQTTHVSDNGSAAEQSLQPSLLCYGIDWKPDVTLMGYPEIQSHCQDVWKDEVSETSFFADLALLQYSYLTAARPVLEIDDSHTLAPHLNKYKDWARLRLQEFEEGVTGYPVSAWKHLIKSPVFMDDLADRLERTNRRGKFFVTVGRNLQNILMGQKDPIQIFFADGLADDYYAEYFSSTSCSLHVERYIELLAHKTPTMKVLEIGGGTGGFTNHILGPLTAGAQARCEQFVFTDISPSFFERIREAWKAQPVNMDFRTLDIEQNPDTQGFKDGTFDLIVAGNVLHATADIRATLTNVRKLLKPGGKLVLFEVTEPEIIRAAFAFGLLPGWWLSKESERQHGPLMSTDTWATFLKETGFSGTDIILRDYQDQSSWESSVIVATAVETSTDQSDIPDNVTVLIDDKSPYQRDVAHKICDRIGGHIMSFDGSSQLADLQARKVVSLLEADGNILSTIDSDRFAQLKTLLATTNDLIWLTQDITKSPEANMVSGFARTLRIEKPDIKFITLAMEDHHQPASDVAYYVQACIEANINATVSRLETEYCVKQDQLCISRLQQLPQLNDTCNEILTQHTPVTKERKLGDCQPVKLVVGTPGLLDSLHFVEDHDVEIPLADYEIEMEVAYTDLNFMDVLTVMGSLNQATLGGACAGTVTRVGASVEHLRKGDRVAACILGCMRTFARQRAELVTRIPNTMGLEEAVAVLCTHVTAYHGLIDYGRLSEGETVLIQSGAGGTGQAAIQVAQLYGAEVFVTVGSQTKKQMLMTEYNIPEDHIFYSRDTSFAKGVMRMTNGRGVDMIFNSLSGDKLVASWQLMAPCGRFIEIGKKDVHGHGNLPMFPFAKNVSFHCLDLASLLVDRPKDFGRSIKVVMDLVHRKKLDPARPVSSYTISKIVDAFRYLQSGQNSGKTIIHFNKEDTVPCHVRSLPNYSFKSDATYVIAGGLGGLGRSIAQWMSERGAKNLILLSRRGPREQEHHDFLARLRETGVRVEAPPCDVTSAEALLSIISMYSEDMPSVKGCIQSTMVLQDLIFDNMDHSSWLAATRPKVQGSWNLHECLPTDLDFFIMLSSAAGIVGSPAQSNYAAGNTYQDALAAHRLAQGQTAVSLDVGWMADEGYVASNARAQQNLKGAGILKPLSKYDLLALLDHYCHPSQQQQQQQSSSTTDTSGRAHVVFGLELPASLRARSIEEPQFMQMPIFSSLQVQPSTDASANDSTSNSSTKQSASLLLEVATTLVEAKSIVLEAFTAKLWRAIGVDATSGTETLDASKPLFSFGVDSLVALELKNWVAKFLGSEVSVLELLSETPVTEIMGQVAVRSRFYAGPKE